MSMIVTIPDDLAARLAAFALTASATPEQVALAAIRRDLTAQERLDESLAPIRAAFEASGMTEDEAGELFDAERRAWREEQRAAGK